MSDSEVRPEVTAVFEHRKASSDCCAAGLGVSDTGAWWCRACGRACGRVLGDPVEVTAHG